MRRGEERRGPSIDSMEIRRGNYERRRVLRSVPSATEFNELERWNCWRGEGRGKKTTAASQSFTDSDISRGGGREGLNDHDDHLNTGRFSSPVYQNFKRDVSV